MKRNVFPANKDVAAKRQSESNGSQKERRSMLEQLVKEWREQAGINRGMRGYVFSVCADQLEETIQKLGEQSAEVKAKEIISSMLRDVEKEPQNNVMPKD